MRTLTIAASETAKGWLCVMNGYVKQCWHETEIEALRCADAWRDREYVAIAERKARPPVLFIRADGEIDDELGNDQPSRTLWMQDIEEEHVARGLE